MAKKKVKASVKLQIFAGKANPSPPIGPALGQQGINIIEFCKAFNSRTEKMEKDLPISVIVTVYEDRSFTFVIKSPPTSMLLKKFAGIKSGSGKTKAIDSVGKITQKQVEDIVKIKKNDMTGSNTKAIISSVVGTAFSMGLEVEGYKYGKIK